MQDLAREQLETTPEATTEESAALADRRDVKIKLPATLVLRLYYMKLTTSLNYSDVVEEALVRYFAEKDGEAGAIPGLQVALGGNAE